MLSDKTTGMIEAINDGYTSKVWWTTPYDAYGSRPKRLRLAYDRMLAMGVTINRALQIIDAMSIKPKQSKPYDKSLHKKGRVKKPWE